MLRFIALCAALTIPVVATNLHAQVARLVHYQGELKSEDGSPFTGVADLEFAIYTSPAAEEPLWSETHRNVSVSDGTYDVMLGSKNPLNLSFHEYFLEVRVNGQPSTEPRVRIVGSGYNFRLWFLFSAYTIVWVGLFLYMFSLGRKQKRIHAEMESLKGVGTVQ